MKPRSHSLASLSRWLVGSSSRSTSLPANRMRAISTRRFWPPESDADRQVEAVGLEPEPGGDAAHLALGRVAAVEPELLLGAGEAAHRSLGGVLLHLEAQLLDAHHGLVEPPARQDVAHRGGGVVDAVEPRVLGQVAEAAGAVHDAGVGRLGAAQHLEQAGLAGAVAADQADLVAGADREAGALEDDGATHLDGELADLQHRTMLTGRGARGRTRWPPCLGAAAPRPTAATDRVIDVLGAASLDGRSAERPLRGRRGARPRRPVRSTAHRPCTRLVLRQPRLRGDAAGAGAARRAHRDKPHPRRSPPVAGPPAEPCTASRTCDTPAPSAVVICRTAVGPGEPHRARRGPASSSITGLSPRRARWRLGSAGDPAAVDGEGLAGHVAGRVAGEEEERAVELVGARRRGPSGSCAS